MIVSEKAIESITKKSLITLVPEIRPSLKIACAMLRRSKILERDFGWLWVKKRLKILQKDRSRVLDSAIFENRVCRVKMFEDQGFGTRFWMIVDEQATKSIIKRSLSCLKFGHLWKSRCSLSVLRHSKVLVRDWRFLDDCEWQGD